MDLQSMRTRGWGHAPLVGPAVPGMWGSVIGGSMGRPPTTTAEILAVFNNHPGDWLAFDEIMPHCTGTYRAVRSALTRLVKDRQLEIDVDKSNQWYRGRNRWRLL